MNLPETNLFFTSETRYPEPRRLNSRPDIVVPSQLNCVETVVGVDGPAATSNLPLSEPTPLLVECCDSSVSFQTARCWSFNLCRPKKIIETKINYVHKCTSLSIHCMQTNLYHIYLAKSTNLSFQLQGVYSYIILPRRLNLFLFQTHHKLSKIQINKVKLKLLLE